MSEHELWNELGNLYFMSGAYGQAVHAYQRSIKLDSSFGRPYSNLALTYVQQGKFDEAIELYRRSIELLAENKEKAISWNRLGTVYRHLKDYSQAVIAFQEADELDPQSSEEFPVPADERADPVMAPSSVLDAPAESEPAADSPVEWWDLPQEPAFSPASEPSPMVDQEDDLTTSWTPADPSEFQSNVSRIPGAGSLTTWGDGNFDDDFEEFSPLDPEPGADLPDPDDDIATWLSVPEEAPLDLQDVRVPAFVEVEQEALESEAFQNEPAAYHVIESIEYAPLLTAGAAASSAGEVGERGEQAWNSQELDVDVQDRPTSDFGLVLQVQEDSVDSPSTETMAAAEQPLPEPLPSPEEIPPAAEPPESDEEYLHEIEMGIAKFRRVVQLNPRNAHAWDALGTLYKSAGLYRDAILSYQQAISNDPSKSLYYHHLGLVYACEGRDEDAIGAFQRVIEIDPEYSLAHATLGGYYRKMGLEELAQKHIGKAMKNIFDSENEYNRACLEAICGNADQAIELLGVALKNKQTYVDWILRDPDLDFIRQDPRFKQLISEYTR
jgi:tetratricopeptide (TPR) repeat protein